MNQNLLLAKNKIAQYKMEAESKRDLLMMELDKDDNWKNLNLAIRKKQVEIGFLKNRDTTALRKELETLLQKRDHYLTQHNLNSQALEPDYHCKKCCDSGLLNGVHCQCLSRELRKVLFESSNIFDTHCTFANSTESNIHNQKIYLLCEEFCNKLHSSKYKNILLIGKTGTGKTYLMKAIANRLIEREIEVFFTTAYNLNQMLLNCYLADVESKEIYLNNLLDVDVLAIDDLGCEQILRNVTLEYLFILLNERKERGKSTLVSTNLGLKNDLLRDRYEDRIFSRLVDQRDTLIFELEGKDKRVKS